MSRSSFTRQPLDRVISRYARIAPFYRYGEFTILLLPGFRKRAISRLELTPGQRVLEIGCGTGRNLRYLRAAVGSSGAVIGVDVTPGMLRQAHKLVRRNGWSNVELVNQDASTLALDAAVDAVYFSLSYSVMPDRPAVLAAAWRAVRPGGRLVIMDAGIPASGPWRLLGRPAEIVATAFPGDPYSEPWVDLEAFGAVKTERFQGDMYFVCSVGKP